jgi:hypothetical protein
MTRQAFLRVAAEAWRWRPMQRCIDALCGLGIGAAIIWLGQRLGAL